MCTQYTVFIIKKINPDYPKTAAMGCFPLGTQEQVRNSHGKRGISVQATEVLLYPDFELSGRVWQWCLVTFSAGTFC